MIRQENLTEKERIHKENILNIINKEQYKLKLGIVYLVASGFNFCMLGVSYLLYKSDIRFFTLDVVITIYIIAMILYYKFSFNLTKDGHHLRAFLFRILGSFNAKIDKSLREQLKRNSAEKITKKGEQ
ncbi:hypothetical protein [Campylobacter sp. CCUG 57310]|uniref:hypothetical protein n=1 Tax=Campylobacter sp. CCUG 57310 TaxID=2517362 RepID=UPI0015675785|nr:hypothetical protein [Campylobacter sp. CCUG 57310]QKF93199.1 hypothetical protein CORI_a013 [Campylobacter sp. CCUG 57310]